ncbi:unnamed protein product [Prunus armeniaca]
MVGGDSAEISVESLDLFSFVFGEEDVVSKWAQHRFDVGKATGFVMDSEEFGAGPVRLRLMERRLADLEAANQHDEAVRNDQDGERHHDRRNDRDSERHNFHYCDEQDLDERVMRLVKVDASYFDGEINPKKLIDLLAYMDRYFEWHDMSEA